MVRKALDRPNSHAHKPWVSEIAPLPDFAIVIDELEGRFSGV